MKYTMLTADLKKGTAKTESIDLAKLLSYMEAIDMICESMTLTFECRDAGGNESYTYCVKGTKE